MWSDF